MKYSNIILGLIWLLLMSSIPCNGQDKLSIKFKDKEELTPIIGASYTYGSQQGISNKDGTITLILEKGQDLFLSHIYYGQWSVEYQYLIQIENGATIYQPALAVDLSPVTVIAVRPSLNPNQDHHFDFQDKLSHDGGVILNGIASFNSIRKSGAYGFDPVFRGFKYDQLNIVMDGAQGATAACPNRMDPATSQFAPNMIKKVEVLKGPYALRYGTGIGGTVNFLTSSLFKTNGKNITGRISGAYEGNGNVRRTEAQLGINQASWSINFLSSLSTGDDYISGGEHTIQSDFTRGSFGVMGGFIKNNHEISLQSFYNRARDVDFPALPMDLRNDDTWMFRINHKYQPDGGRLREIHTSLFGSWVDHRMDNLLKPLDPRMMNAYTEALTSNYGMRTEGVWDLKGHRLYAGADIKVESAEGSRVREFLLGQMKGKIINDNAWQAGKITKAGLFSEFQMSLSSVKVMVAGRLEFNRASINEPSDEFLAVYEDGNSNQVNPSISLGFSRNLNSKSRIGLWLGRAQRSGGLTERYINYFPVGQDPYELIGNPELNPEVNYQADLTYDRNSGASTFSLNVFTSYMTDYISSVIDGTLIPRLPASPGVRRYINIDNVFKTGMEADWSVDISDKLFSSISMAYTYAQDLERDEPLPEIAPLDLRWNVQASLLNNQLKPEINFRRVFTQSRVSTEFGETETPSFNLINVGMSYTFKSNFIFRLGVENLFNTTYYEHLNRAVRGTGIPIYARGRSVNTSVNYNF